ncbi:PREDICTED: bifunctional arginine demethylase and lysyl-hydroxylase JMJD6 [Nicrophorus vespilloides]|uniref:Bifunctional arginine demethylase and lysyl-hydroxylase JMJD6 n=1 Tax=Nicrophorus vespilloides TaxID=110193 RepID=A0ABM1N5T6_NICVS|nr:PREDICTED: bifunctional arginine demethylase and lysyl-hydroxylase JMJD6 [Nicrophorus vespilloides]XP_017782185.1 PREDICTED: bifunctional arginine demethylase and lysyl-hydroxylase JMJD6 [Nicrophorus vespilloides]XP_017782186.1 PREDICTED: bifunctional arginine demethylase and lysyl-hydroxylase JMJD6 [Nicrophorus vespilloides]
MQRAEKRFQAILRKSKLGEIPMAEISQLDISKLLCKRRKARMSSIKKIALVTFSLVLAVWVFGEKHSQCVLDMPIDASKAFREVVDCGICKNLGGVDKVMNISPSDFEERYVAKARPVVVLDGTRGWSAVDNFDFSFFKKLYSSYPKRKQECQFFPYKTEFESLREALNMSEDRSRLEPKTTPWYIGWSNCNDDAGKVLREYYDRPYFLPETSENMALSWIFMGGPGDGAHMHVDNVHYPSWQAQLRGRKKWRIAPPPECLYSCKEFQVVVNPGEIIVVDTNRWYHQTHILPGDISVTIGSEFD